MALQIGETAPDFEAQTTEGPIRFHDWIGDSWAILFSHPKDFTPVCTTELGYLAKIKPEFDKRNTKIVGLSADALDRHKEWAKDIEETQGHAPNYPIIADDDFLTREVSSLRMAVNEVATRDFVRDQLRELLDLVGIHQRDAVGQADCAQTLGRAKLAAPAPATCNTLRREKRDSIMGFPCLDGN